MNEAEKAALQSKIDNRMKSRYRVIQIGKEYVETATKVNKLAELIEKIEKYERIVKESRGEFRQLSRKYERIKPNKDYL